MGTLYSLLSCQLAARISRFSLLIIIIGVLTFAHFPTHVAHPTIPLPQGAERAVWMTAKQAKLTPEAWVEPQISTRGNGIIDECNNTVGNLYCMRQNVSLNPENGNSSVCILENHNGLIRMAETRYYRLFDLESYESDLEAQPNAAFVISTIGVGIELSQPSSGNNRQPIYINLYQTDLTRQQLESSVATIAKDNTTMIASYRYEKLETPHERGGIYEGITTSDEGKVIYFPFHALIEANQRFLIEVVVPTSELVEKDSTTSNGHILFIGSNKDGQSFPNPSVEHKSYIASPACGIPEPTVVDEVGMAHMRTIIFPVGVYANHFTELAPTPFAPNPSFENNIDEWCVNCGGSEASWRFPKNGAYQGQGFIRFEGVVDPVPPNSDGKTIVSPLIEPINFPPVPPQEPNSKEYVGFNFFASVKKNDLTNLRVRVKLDTPEGKFSVAVKSPTCFTFPLPGFNAPPPAEGRCASDVTHWQGFSYWSEYFSVNTINKIDQLQIRYKDNAGRVKFDLMSLVWVRLGNI